MERGGSTRIRILVWMSESRQTVIGVADILLRGGALDFKDFVVVGFWGAVVHFGSCGSEIIKDRVVV